MTGPACAVCLGIHASALSDGEMGLGRNSADYEDQYAAGAGVQTSDYGANLICSMVHRQVRLLGDGNLIQFTISDPGREMSTGDMLSSEEAGINRPGARTNHGQSAPEDRQYEWDQGIRCS